MGERKLTYCFSKTFNLTNDNITTSYVGTLLKPVKIVCNQVSGAYANSKNINTRNHMFFLFQNNRY